MSVTQVCPGRNAGRGGVAGGGTALAHELKSIICIDGTPVPHPKIASPTYSASAQAERKYHLRTSGGAREGSARGEVWRGVPRKGLAGC